MTTYVIGDVHGCLDELEELVEKAIRPSSSDQVVLVGDLMDKGPAPALCVEYARVNGLGMVLGNHEEKHLRWRRHEDRRREDPSYVNPMRTMKEADRLQNEALKREDVEWLRGLPVVLDPEPGWIVVHGGILPGRPLESQLASKKDVAKMLRLRWVGADGDHVPLDYDDLKPGAPEGARHWTEVYDGRHNVVYGHEAFNLRLPRVSSGLGGTTWGIDTGAVHGGHLTALVLEAETPPGLLSTVQVKARRKYADPPFPIPG